MPNHTAYIFAHPGHEFRLLQTLSDSPSVVYIFTQGSRAATSTARISASRKLADELGAKHGEVFGVATDREFYQAIMDKNVPFFETLITQLVTSFSQHKVRRVILDSWQNYNPIHDLTHLCGRLACERYQAMTGQSLAVFDYPVVFGALAGAPIGPIASNCALDNVQVAAKMAAIKAYPDIADDAEALIRMDDNQALRHETLHHLLPVDDLEPPASPFYEDYGRKRVASGAYTDVITWPHVRAIVTGLTNLQSCSQKSVA